MVSDIKRIKVYYFARKRLDFRFKKYLHNFNDFSTSGVQNYTSCSYLELEYLKSLKYGESRRHDGNFDLYYETRVSFFEVSLLSIYTIIVTLCCLYLYAEQIVDNIRAYFTYGQWNSWNREQARKWRESAAWQVSIFLLFYFSVAFTKFFYPRKQAVPRPTRNPIGSFPSYGLP